MNFSEYQTAAASTAIYPSEVAIEYLGLKLASEAGEVAGVLGKVIRDGMSDREATRTQLKKELGDCLWYVSQLSKELGFSLEEVAIANIEKLQARAKKGTLRGSGDDR